MMNLALYLALFFPKPAVATVTIDQCDNGVCLVVTDDGATAVVRMKAKREGSRVNVRTALLAGAIKPCDVQGGTLAIESGNVVVR